MSFDPRPDYHNRFLWVPKSKIDGHAVLAREVWRLVYRNARKYIPIGHRHRLRFAYERLYDPFNSCLEWYYRGLGLDAEI